MHRRLHGRGPSLESASLAAPANAGAARARYAGGALSIRSLRDFYYVLFRHKLAVAASVLVSLGAFGASAFLLPNEYRSEAKLLLRAGRDLRVDPAVAAAGPVVSVPQSRESRMNSEIEIMRSRPLLVKAGEASGRIAGPTGTGGSEAERAAHLERALVRIEDDLRIETRDENDVIQLSFTDVDPKRAQRFLEELVEAYRERHIEVHSTSSAYAFFGEQAAELEVVVAEREAALRDLKLETGVTSIEDQRRTLVSRIDARETALEDLRAEISAGEASLAALTLQLESVPEMTVLEQSKGLPATAFDTLVNRLYELRLQQLDASSKYSPDSRVLRDLEAQIDGAKAMLQRGEGPEAQVVEGINETHRALELARLQEASLLASRLARESTLLAQVARAREDLDGFHGVESEIRRLTRELEIAETNLQRYQESLERARIDRALENDRIANISVVQAATVPGRPAGPHRTLLLVAGIALAGLLGAGVSFGLEALDDSVHTPEDLEAATGLRPVAVLPASSAAFRRGAWTHGDPSSTWWNIPDAPALDRGDDAPWELRDDGEDPNRRCRVLAVTSDRRGSGVTTVAASLAESLAREGNGARPVLLVDANLDDPQLSRMVDAENEPGLTDGVAMAGMLRTETRETPVEGLRLLPRGTSADDFDAGLDPGALVAEVERMAAEFAWVVVDLPANLGVDALAALRERVDGLLLVVEADRTRRQVARFLTESLADGPGGAVGLVLNKRSYPIPGWLYHRL